MSCKCAPSLRKALDDATKRWPKRSRLSDGCCADDRHVKAGRSDHIADASGYAHAADLTHNPENGVDCNKLVTQVLYDARVKYVIFNRKIYYQGSPPKAYTGANAHDHHMHISIKPNAHLDLSPWPWSPRLAASAQEAAGDDSPTGASDSVPEAIAAQQALAQGEGGTSQQTPATASITVKDGNVNVETSEGIKPLELVAIEKPPSQNFAATIRNKITTVTGGNVTLALARDYAEQARLFGLSLRFWFWISFIAAAATVIYLLAAFYKHRSDTARDLEITNQLIAANTTDSNRVELVDADRVEEFKAKGFKIVKR
jgi:hypothetical protein